jgi:hypothetical protein
MQLVDPSGKQRPRGITQNPDRCCEAATVVQVVLNRSFLLRLGVPRSANVAGRQVMALLKLPEPALESVLRWIAELANGQADSFAQLDVEPHGSKSIFV